MSGVYIRVYCNGRKIRSTCNSRSSVNYLLNNFGYYCIPEVKLSFKEILSYMANQIPGDMLDDTSIESYVFTFDIMKRNKSRKVVQLHLESPVKFVRMKIAGKDIVTPSMSMRKQPLYSIRRDHMYIDGKSVYKPYVSDIELVSRVKNVITCENWNKWYDLYYIDNDYNVKILRDSYHGFDDIEILDHSWEPRGIVDFAKKHNLKIGRIAYLAMVIMYTEYKCEDFLNDDDLPTYDDLKSVIVEDYGIMNLVTDTESYNSYVSHPLFQLCTLDPYNRL